MATNSTTQHGSFVSDGTAKIIPINTDIDIIRITNLTEMAASNSGHGFVYHWLKDSNGWVEYHPAADHTSAVDVLASGAFTIIDSSKNPVGALDSTISGISNAAIPLVTITSTADLCAGDVVRLFDVTGVQQFGGLDFTIGNSTFSGTTFTLDYAPQIVAGTTGSFRKISYDTIYAPRARNITKITAATSAVATFSVTHDFTVGQVIRFNVSAAFGMTEINGLRGTVTAISTANNTVTVDIDSSGFTAFAFPLTAADLFSPAQVVPVGETAAAHSGLPYQDAVYNTAYKGVKLQAGIKTPGGSTSDVIHWEISSTFK